MRRNAIDDFLQQVPLMIVDGGLATELEARGADLRDPLWSAKLLIEQPELIHATHLEYFRAGADVATTASYQATFEACAHRGIGAEGAAALMRKSIELALAARDEFWADRSHRTSRLRPLVAASIGPYGAMLGDGAEYRGHYALDDAALMRFHRPRLEVLADAGADLLAIETIPSLREALILAQLLESRPDTAGWISFSCGDAAMTWEGQNIGDCASALNPFAQVAAIGVNCTSPELVAPLLGRLRASTAKPLIAYPNSGEHYDAGTKRWLGCAARTRFADLARDWYAAGARLIGGCCRTTPQDIREIKAWAGSIAA